MSHFSDSTSSLAPDSSIRKLLRSKRTKAFFKTDGTWTKNISMAMALRWPTAPSGVSTTFKPEEIEIYFSFDNNRETQWDFALPFV